MISIATLLAAAVASAAPTQKSNLMMRVCDAGEHRQFSTATCDVELTNLGDKPIVITEAQALMQSDRIEPATVVVPPHGAAYLKATVSVGGSIGYLHRFFRLKTDEPGVLAKRQADVQVFATTILDQGAPVIEFGAVRVDAALPSKSVTLSTREVANFQLTEVISKPEYLDVGIEGGRTIKATLRQDAPWGLLSDKIRLRTNSPIQPEVWISFNANVEGDIVPDSNPLLLGVIRTDAKNEFLLRLTSRSKTDFKLGKLQLEGMKGKISDENCTPRAAGCRLLKLKIADDQSLGRLGGTLTVEVPALQRSLSIKIGGLLLSPTTPVHDLNKETEKAKVAEGEAKSSVAEAPENKPVDLKDALQRNVEKAPSAAVPSGNGPLLSWSVDSQYGVYGYIIYRSDSAEGPFLRMNDVTIRVRDDDGKYGGRYQWRDNSAVSGKTYWYSIGTMKDSGERGDLTGAQKIVAK